MTEHNDAKATGRTPRPAKSDTASPRAPRAKGPRAQADELAAADAEAPPPPNVDRKPSKLDAVIALLRRPEGVTLDEIVAATGWQRHSARGALAGAVKKKLGAGVVSERADGVLRYRAPEPSQ